MTMAVGHSALQIRSSGASSTLELAIDGIVSPSAISEIENALIGVSGLMSARLNLTTHRLSTEWAHPQFNPAPIFPILERLGYRAVPFTGNSAEADENNQTKWLLRCLAVAGFATLNVMLLSVSVWSGNITDITPETRDFFHWLSALIALPAAGFAGQPFFLNAIRAIRAGEMTMDVPISVGILLALGMSVAETAIHAEHVYFDSALMLLFFLLAGRVLDHAMRLKTRALASNLAALRASTALRLGSDGTSTEVSPDTLVPGDVLLARAGDRIAADGTVIEGSSYVDESFVTGETAVRPINVGEKVFAGMLNGTGVLRISVATTGASTLLAEIERLIHNAVTAKSRYVQIADRIARLYAPIVHIAAAITAMGWILSGASVHDALIIAIAVLIITCPCALALAAPTVQVVVAGALFKQGILMRSGDVIERMAEVDTIVFDKTGTLTLPEPVPLNAAEIPAELLSIASRLAETSHHPLARSIRELAPKHLGPSEALHEASEEAGHGVRASINGVEARLGSPEFCNMIMPQGSDSASIIGVRYGTQSAVIRIGQKMRCDAAETISTLMKLGFRILILSGDHENAVRPVAHALGIADWQAAMKPADKLIALDALKQKGHKILMVGDGLNDAPALAAASVSLSPATGADVTQAVADAVFLGNRLAAVKIILNLCRSGRAIMRENFAIALIYNLIAIPLAVAGQVTPLIAAAAMSGSSILVTANALRARNGKGRQ